VTGARIVKMSTTLKKFKMAVVIDTRMKQTVVIELLIAEVVNPIDTHRRLNSVWVRHFKSGERNWEEVLKMLV
jgi:hypothetical protein